MYTSESNTSGSTTAYPESSPEPAVEAPSLTPLMISDEETKPVTVKVSRVSTVSPSASGFSSKVMVSPTSYASRRNELSAISSAASGMRPSTTS